MKILSRPLSNAIIQVCLLAGVIINLTPSRIFLPFKIFAAISKSPILPFVHDPMNAWSIGTPLTSLTTLPFVGLSGVATIGPSGLFLISYVRESVYSASLSGRVGFVYYQKYKEGKDGKENNAPTSDSEVKYSYNGKKFIRKVEKRKLSPEEKEAYKKSLEQSASFLDGSSYKLEYHFPKAIKSTTYKGALFSDDRKTMYIQADMKSITENPKLLDFEVILK